MGTPFRSQKFFLEFETLLSIPAQKKKKKKKKKKIVGIRQHPMTVPLASPLPKNAATPHGVADRQCH
jgi:hypothetical protein